MNPLITAPSSDCPHCRQCGTLAATAQQEVDTDQVTVVVWQCSACDYTEGRPPEPPPAPPPGAPA